ncbi:MAG: hypothetical protein OEY94_01400 [Alphaproteobacteria bacterium]|nr:hypothetical protein [Alphaproteobacteria bacterium]
MSESFLLAIKWYMISLGLIIGFSAFIISQKINSMDPIIIGIIGLGSSYIMASIWKDFRDKLLLVSGVSFVTLALISPKMGYVVFLLFDYADPINPYILWALTTGAIGIPAMTIIFRIINR